jgi:NAD(P)H-flavin reductase
MGSTAGSPVNAMSPVAHRVRARRVENQDTATLYLDPANGHVAAPEPGQFMMLYAYGVGEVAISASRCDPTPGGSHTHTIRKVGAVSRALHGKAAGEIVGVRGPFGTSWDLGSAQHRDLVIVAGGVGLAPLRPAIDQILARRSRYGRVALVAGARSRSEFLFQDELTRWAHEGAVDVHLTVDVPVQGWRGELGLVTEPLRRLTLRPERTIGLVCGPESMMSSSAQVLVEKGLAPADVRISLERNMQCGVGWCGHCQLGPLLLCRDGPVVSYATAAPLLQVSQL